MERRGVEPAWNGELSASRIVATERDEIVAAWRELCRWDPLLPADAQPAIAPAVVDALAAALTRPQPLGWGADPEIEKVAEVFATNVESVDIAVGQFVCLREAVRSQIEGRIPEEEREETAHRLVMIVDRAIGVAVGHAARLLARDAFMEPLTGLLNRRALERDVRRQIGRSARSSRTFTLMMIDVNHLGRVNERDGHRAGDALVEQMAAAVREALGEGTSGYRFGANEFIALLAGDAPDADAELARRLEQAGAPSFSWGSAVYPTDGEDLEPLVDCADRRLLECKRRRSVGGDEG